MLTGRWYLPNVLRAELPSAVLVSVQSQTSCALPAKVTRRRKEGDVTLLFEHGARYRPVA